MGRVAIRPFVQFIAGTQTIQTFHQTVHRTGADLVFFSTRVGMCLRRGELEVQDEIRPIPTIKRRRIALTVPRLSMSSSFSPNQFWRTMVGMT